MRTLPLLLSGLVALGASGCSGNDNAPGSGVKGGAPTSSPTSATTTAAASASVTATASAKAPAAKPPRKAPKSYAALKADLDKKCPVESKDTNVEQKEAAAKAIECLRKKMIADLDAVLVPLKKSDETKFKALMKEQAEWNRNIEVACKLEEERFWIDLATGGRDDGTMRSYTYLGCLSGAYTDRILYAQSLAAGKLPPLVKRIEETQKDGAEVKRVLAEIKNTAEGFVKSPPKLEAGVESADWGMIASSCEKVATASASMAKSTCEAWPDLAKELGGKDKCAAKVELYYFVQGGSPSVTGEN